MGNTEKRTIEIIDEEGQEGLLYVVSQTRIGGVNYFLVSEDEVPEELEEEPLEDGEEGDVVDVFLIKEVPESADEDSVSYELVEDEKELGIVTKVFEEMLDDVDFEIED